MTPIEAISLSEDLTRYLNLAAKHLDTGRSFEGPEHSITVFYISPVSQSEINVCDDNKCSEPGMFMKYTQDHMGQHFINIYCKEHSPEGYFRMLERSTSA